MVTRAACETVRINVAQLSIVRPIVTDNIFEFISISSVCSVADSGHPAYPNDGAAVLSTTHAHAYAAHGKSVELLKTEVPYFT